LKFLMKGLRMRQTGGFAMPTLNFTDQEQEFFVEMLEREIPNLREEILHTDDSDYREFLKQREEFVKGLLRKLKESK